MHALANHIATVPEDDARRAPLISRLERHQNAYTRAVTAFMTRVTGRHGGHRKPAEIRDLLLLMIREQRAATAVQEHLLDSIRFAVCLPHVAPVSHLQLIVANTVDSLR